MIVGYINQFVLLIITLHNTTNKRFHERGEEVHNRQKKNGLSVRR